MSWTRCGGTTPSALASWATTGPLAAGLDELLAARRSRRQHLAVGGDREAPRRALGEQRALGRLASLARPPPAPPPARRAGRCRQRRPRARAPSASPRQTAPARRRRGRRAPPRGAAAGRAARTRRNTSRTRERSGSRAASAAMSKSTPTSRWTVASCLDMRASSACSSRFCLRFGPLMSSMWSSTSSSEPNALDQLAGGLVADPGNAGDVVGGVSLEPVEVGDQLRRDAVAVDHGLAVVDLRLGDAPRRRHHLHQAVVVDQLEDVAVARHDRHRHRRARPAARAAPATRSRRRPRSPRRARCVAERLHQRFHRRPLLLEQVRARAALGLVVGEHLVAARGAGIPGHDASGTTPYSVTILTSIEANPKIALVGSPVEVAIDSGARRRPGRRGSGHRSGTAAPLARGRRPPAGGPAPCRHPARAFVPTAMHRAL